MLIMHTCTSALLVLFYIESWNFVELNYVFFLFTWRDSTAYLHFLHIFLFIMCHSNLLTRFNVNYSNQCVFAADNATKLCLETLKLREPDYQTKILIRSGSGGHRERDKGRRN